MSKATFFNNCVNWPRDDVCALGGLSDMVEQAKPITRETFLKHVDPISRVQVETALGYRRGDALTMKRDFAVHYYKSKHHGKTVYFFDHSAIEYVFK